MIFCCFFSKESKSEKNIFFSFFFKWGEGKGGLASVSDKTKNANLKKKIFFFFLVGVGGG